MRRIKASMHEQATGVEQAKGKKSATKPCCRGYSSQRRILAHVKGNKYFELKNSWGANGAPQTQTTC